MNPADLDTSLLLTLNALGRCGWTDAFMMLFTGRWVWVPLYCSILAMLCLRLGWRRGLAAALLAALCVAAADQLCASLLRPLICRPRPSNAESGIAHMVMTVGGYRGGRWGMPSCHAANSFALAVATALAMRSRPYTLTVMLWAAANCYTRLYLGVHYPGDLLAGALLGSALAAALTAAAVSRWPALFQPRPAPAGGLTVGLPAAVMAATVAAMAVIAL